MSNRRERRWSGGQGRQGRDGTGSSSRLFYLVGVGVLVVVAAIAVIVVAALGRGSEVPTEARPSADTGAAITGTDVSEPEDSLATLEEFGDFQCSHCVDFALGMGRQVKEEFVSTGRIRFVFRHYPFIGEESFRAAEATECAADQGKLWEYHDTVFENWKGVNEGHFSDDKLKGFASTLALDRASFDACLDDGKYRAKVAADVADGERRGVRGTPALFLNGRRVQPKDYAELARLIEAEIAAPE